MNFETLIVIFYVTCPKELVKPPLFWEIFIKQLKSIIATKSYSFCLLYITVVDRI
jgi:hypothetical protein